ncbi:MAG: hypothetical protein ACM3IL_00860 [Deltaproteobacteria bacterium]
MAAGVPGSGISGFFYLLSALLMPVQEFVSIYHKKSSRASRRKVARQVVNASGVLCGVWLTGWFISRAYCSVSASMHSQGHHVSSVPRLINPIYGLITLLSVFLFIQVLSVALRRIHSRR